MHHFSVGEHEVAGIEGRQAWENLEVSLCTRSSRPHLAGNVFQRKTPMISKGPDHHHLSHAFLRETFLVQRKRSISYSQRFAAEGKFSAFAFRRGCVRACMCARLSLCVSNFNLCSPNSLSCSQSNFLLCLKDCLEYDLCDRGKLV